MGCGASKPQAAAQPVSGGPPVIKGPVEVKAEDVTKTGTVTPSAAPQAPTKQEVTTPNMDIGTVHREPAKPQEAPKPVPQTQPVQSKPASAQAEPKPETVQVAIWEDKSQYDAVGRPVVFDGCLRGKPVQLGTEKVCDCNTTLGEAPMWNVSEGALYWLDINGKKLWKYANGSTCSWVLPEVAGSFAFTKESGKFLVGFKSGLTIWNCNSGARIYRWDFEPGENTRPNDGKCDKLGNFVIGSYNCSHREDKKNIAGLYRLRNGMVEEILNYRFRCSNTIAFSPQGDYVYFCDTPTKKIFRFKYLPDKPLSEKTLFYT